MPTCDMCGKEARLIKAKIEGTVLDVCPNCARFGEVIARPAPIFSKNILAPRQATPVRRRREIVQVIVENYGQKIKEARERKGLTQEQFAGRLNEKESIIQKMESEHFKPSIKLARKLERVLHVRLVEEYSESGEIPIPTAKSKTDGFTLGDFVKDKRSSE